MRYMLLTLSLFGGLAVLPAAHSQEAARRKLAVSLTGSDISLASSPSTVFNGTPITLKADVQTTQGGTAPSGTVSFFYGGWLLGSAQIANHTAQITVPTKGIPAGTYGLYAVYSGDWSYAASTSADSYVYVSCDSNSTSDMAASPGSLKAGGIVTLATDVSMNQGGAIPTGYVYFYVSTGSFIGSAPLMAGVATLNVPTTGIPPGTYAIYSVYQGDAIYEPSTSETDYVTVTAQ